jgi:translation initiation factor 3 subunit C
MSFFARLGSDSDSDSSGSESEESILSGEEGEEQDARIARPTGRASQFLRSDGDDSSDEDESDDDDSDDEAPKKTVRPSRMKMSVMLMS